MGRILNEDQCMTIPRKKNKRTHDTSTNKQRHKVHKFLLRIIIIHTRRILNVQVVLAKAKTSQSFPLFAFVPHPTVYLLPSIQTRDIYDLSNFKNQRNKTAIQAHQFPLKTSLNAVIAIQHSSIIT